MSSSLVSAILKYLFRPAQILWRLLPRPVRHRIWVTAGPGFQHFYSSLLLARPAPALEPQHMERIVIAGLFSTANGIGAAARSTYRSLQAAGLNPIAVDLSARLAPVDFETDISTQPMPSDLQGTLILQLNAPETMTALELLGMRRNRNWYTIGYWAWELPSFPDGWQRAFKFLSEIWTISEFTAKALRQHPDVPQITPIHHAISPPSEVMSARDTFGIPGAAFTFLAMADSMSSLQRKNPFAAIAAFKQAFGARSDRHLIIKTRNLERHPDAAADLNHAIGEVPNITLMDRSLSEAELWSLLQSCDVFVSLHRCEGFGLVIAEAMALGKPVIVTNWSGNMDFTTPENAFLVEASLIPNEDAYGIYSGFKSEWADVSLDEVVTVLRDVADTPEEGIKRGEKAKADIAAQLKPERIGQKMREALERVLVEDLT